MKRWLISKLGGYPDLQSALHAHEAKDIITRLGGYPDMDSAIEAMREMGWTERHKVLNLAVKRLFRYIHPDDLLRQHGTTWMYKGKPLSPAMVELIKAEARVFNKMILKEIVFDEIEWHGQKKLYTQSEDVPDIVAGKLLIYTKDIVETRLKKMLE